MRIIVVGDLREGQTCRHRMLAMRALGHEVHEVSTADQDSVRADASFFGRVIHRAFGPLDRVAANLRLAQAAQTVDPDIIWLDKALTIAATTLARIKVATPACRIVGYSPDDMYQRHSQSRQFLQHITHYDIYFTTKSFGVRDLGMLGCKRASFIGNSYDPKTHRPRVVTAHERLKYGGAIGFIGTWEAERSETLTRLAHDGFPIRVWGNCWGKRRKGLPNLRIEGRAIMGDEYSIATNAFDINLGFLRKCNRDQQTSRSVEIPACGAFMLAERTGEHCELFKEGEEAEFFGSYRELTEKLRYYLDNPEARRAVADAGHKRCLSSGYSNLVRVRCMLESVQSL